MAKKKYYAWTSPNGAGICESWEECQAACCGQRNEKHKGFATYEEAWAFAYPDVPMLSQEEKNDDSCSVLCEVGAAPAECSC